MPLRQLGATTEECKLITDRTLERLVRITRTPARSVRGANIARAAGAAG